MSQGRDIAKNTIYQAGGKVVGIGFGLLAFSLMARYLGPTDFGVYSTAVTFVSIFGTLADLGLPVLHLRLLALRKKSDLPKIFNLHGVRLLTTLFILVVGILAAQFFPYDARIQHGILISTVGFVAVSFTQYLLPIFQEKLKTGQAAIAEVIGRASMLVIVALAVYLDLGLFTVIWGSALGSLMAFVFSYIFARTLANIKIKFEINTWPELIRLASPLIMVTIFSLIYFKIDTLLLSVLKPTADVGIYSAAYKFMDVFITFPALFTALTLPFFARATGPKNRARLIHIYNRSLKAILIAALPLAVITFIEAERLVVLFAGGEFNDSVAVLRILALAVLPLFLGNLGTTSLIGLGRAKNVAWFFGVAAVFGSIIYYFAIDNFTYFGAAWGTVALESFIAIAATTLIITQTKKLPDLKAILKVALAALGLALVQLLVQPLNIFISLGLGGLSYGALLLLTRVITPTEIKTLLGLAIKKKAL